MGHEPTNATGLDVGQPQPAEVRHRMLLDAAPVIRARRRRQTAAGTTVVRVEPLARIVDESDPGGRCRVAGVESSLGRVVVWRHRGKQHKKAYRTLADARDGPA